MIPFGKFISDKKRLGYWPNANHPLNCYMGDPDWEDMYNWINEYVEMILKNKSKT